MEEEEEEQQKGCGGSPSPETGGKERQAKSSLSGAPTANFLLITNETVRQRNPLVLQGLASKGTPEQN